MADNVAYTLEHIFGALEALGRPITKHRKAGLDLATIRNEVSQIGLSAPSDLIALYACCDGTSTPADDRIGDIFLFPGYYWLSLAEALRSYFSLSSHPGWRREWLPIFASGGGDFYAVICDEKSDDHGALIGFLKGEPDNFVEFSSIQSFLDVINRSYAQGAFYVRDGYLTADYPSMRSIARDVQPEFLGRALKLE